MDLLTYAENHTTLKKTSSTGNGEWSGPCPVCGGNDRFSVQPHNSKGARWFCRGCGEGRWHDFADLAMKVENIGFAEYKRRYEQEVDKLPVVEVYTNAQPAVYFDRAQWENTTEKFVDICEDKLFSHEGEQALTWLHSRGLKNKTLRHWGVGFHGQNAWAQPGAWGWSGNDGKVYLPKGITIPYYPDHLKGVNIRCMKPYDHKYHILRGSERYLFGVETTLSAADTLFLFEAELDAMLAWQECKGLTVAFASMPAAGLFKKEWAVWMTKIKNIVICFDNDDEGQKGAQRLQDQMGRMTHIARIPHGKDLTEFHQQGGNVFDFIYESLELTTG